MKYIFFASSSSYSVGTETLLLASRMIEQLHGHHLDLLLHPHHHPVLFLLLLRGKASFIVCLFISAARFVLCYVSRYVCCTQFDNSALLNNGTDNTHEVYPADTQLHHGMFTKRGQDRTRKSQMGPVQIAKKTDGTGNNSNKDRWGREQFK